MNTHQEEVPALSNGVGQVMRWRGIVACSDRPCKLWLEPQTKGQSSNEYGDKRTTDCYISLASGMPRPTESSTVSMAIINLKVNVQ